DETEIHCRQPISAERTVSSGIRLSDRRVLEPSKIGVLCSIRRHLMYDFNFALNLFHGGGKPRAGTQPPRCRPRPARMRLSPEPLEDRCLPSVTHFLIPTPNTEPMRIARGPAGNLWFAELHSIGRITPGGQVTEFRQGLSPRQRASGDHSRAGRQ